MQARAKISQLAVVVLAASLILAACGGGTTGSTWFNLPSIPVNFGADGSATAFGFNLGPILPAATLQQLQGAGVQKLEVRIGYNGIHVYNNGADLPYLSWDADAVATLQDLLRQNPSIPNNNLIANALPWLRTIGLGVALNLSPEASNVTRWSGETSFTPETPAAVVGPFQLGGIAFDEGGNLSIGSVPGSALGLAGPLLPPNVLGMLESMGIDKLQVNLDPNVIALSMNDRSLPGLAYDSASLAAARPVIDAFAPTLGPTLDTVLPVVQAADLDLAVSFTGEPAGTIELGAVPVQLNADGSLSTFGVAVPGVTLPADLLQQLQTAGLETLNVDVNQEGLFLAANGQTLPTITWTPESLATLAGVVAPIAGVSPDMINGALNLISETGGIKANVGIGDVAASTEEINRTLTAPSGTGGAVLRLDANVENGAITSVEGLGNLADLGIGAVALPANITQILGQLGAQQLELNTDVGKADLLLDGNTALTINWDEPSLQSALQLAGPFLADTPLADPAVAQFVQQQIVPQLPNADVDIRLNLN